MSSQYTVPGHITVEGPFHHVGSNVVNGTLDIQSKNVGDYTKIGLSTYLLDIVIRTKFI